jgi:hypothetical protein
MTLQFCGLFVIVCLVVALIVMASKNGKQAARLKELKREVEGLARAQELASNVYSLDDDTARRKLCELQAKQRK